MTERKRLLLRLDPAIYEAVARWAADDLRSVNAQIEYALRRALRAAGRDHRLGDTPPAGPASVEAPPADPPPIHPPPAGGEGGAEA
jgi:hypothetical protein